MEDIVDRIVGRTITVLLVALGYTVFGIALGAWAVRNGYLP